MNINFSFVFWHIMATIPKMVKFGTFLAYFLPVFTAIVCIVSHSIFEVFLYAKIDFYIKILQKNNIFHRKGDRGSIDIYWREISQDLVILWDSNTFKSQENFSSFLLISWDSLKFVQTLPPPQEVLSISRDLQTNFNNKP